MGTVGKLSGKLIKKSEGTVFGREVGFDDFKPVLKPDANVNPALSFISDCLTNGNLYSTGSSNVIIFFSTAFIFSF